MKKLSTLNSQLSTSSGQTLLEVIVGLGVGVVVLVAITSAVLSSLTGSDFGKNQTQATLYAQQGMEVVRDLRNKEGAGFFSRSGSYCMDSTNSLVPGVCSSPNLDGFFTRKIIFAILGAGRERATVTVSFTDSRGMHESNLVSIFTDWQ
ncbi:hypothetical protein HYW66_00085 [Candidatus Microgenomates bacterium]|nr:hypothetical protein [Candidatus Microgenomates bacterium]